MPTIAADNLPPPHLVDVVDESRVHVSALGSLPFHSQPDPALKPRRLAVAWYSIPGALADAIDRHAAEHPNTVFLFRIPDTGQTLRVQWLTPPTIQWASETTASSVTGELVEALAYVT